MTKKSKYEESTFIRTDQMFQNNAANHNVRRWNWVAEAGSQGRKYSECNAPNSIYRQGIVRKTYNGNESSITQDLDYDIKNGWLKTK